MATTCDDPTAARDAPTLQRLGPLARFGGHCRTIISTLVGLSAVYVAVLVLLGSVYAVIEDKDWTQSLWWAAVTATTVGYGDEYPRTLAGKWVALFLMHFGPGFAFPMATALITARLIVNPHEFEHSEQEQLKAQVDACLREIRALRENEVGATDLERTGRL